MRTLTMMLMGMFMRALMRMLMRTLMEGGSRAGRGRTVPDQRPREKKVA